MSRAIRYLLWTIPAFALVGCTVLGVGAYKLMGPPANPAKYTPDKTPMLVLVENYQYQTSANSHADILSRQLFGAMEMHDVAPMIPPEKLQELRDAKPLEFSTMPINRIGQEAGATQVLYVELKSSDIDPLLGGEAYQGKAVATVKIVDAATGDTIWPTDISGGYPVAASTKLGTKTGATPMAVRQKLYVQLADEISKLFYKWRPEDMRPDTFVE
jgi:hypothetical protein